ncbi:MAG TPA: hypothetical protein VGC03_11385 [Acidimicrobiia bacterium]|jgi:formyltetrahydrofolate hydrolase
MTYSAVLLLACPDRPGIVARCPPTLPSVLASAVRAHLEHRVIVAGRRIIVFE